MTERSRLSQPSNAGRRAPPRAGVTSGATDTESGNDGAGVERDLYALKSLFDRGLIPKDIYDRRVAELMDATKPSDSR